MQLSLSLSFSLTLSPQVSCPLRYLVLFVTNSSKDMISPFPYVFSSIASLFKQPWLLCQNYPPEKIPSSHLHKPKQPTLLHNGQNIPMATCHTLVAYRKNHCSLPTNKMSLPNDQSQGNTWPYKILPPGKITPCKSTPPKWGLHLLILVRFKFEQEYYSTTNNSFIFKQTQVLYIILID